MSDKQAVLFTDCVDIAFNEMHQSLLNELGCLSQENLKIAPLVPIKPYCVINAAFCIRLMAEYYPPQSTFFIVVVHGVKSNPERIFGKTQHGLTFIGNNSGYFSWLLDDFGMESVYENHLSRELNGKSFGGKYVQIPTAAKLIAKFPLDILGQRRDKDFLKKASLSEGTVVHCDNFGLIKIKSPPLYSFQEGQKLDIFVNGVHKIEAIYSTQMKRQVDGTWVLFKGSSLGGLPELGKVRSRNSAYELEVVEGDQITWEVKK